MRLHSQKGQASLPEYVVTFFVVIGAIVAITVYVQRGLQARTYDARNYMVAQAAKDCDADCKAATSQVSNNAILPEYEPYYGQVDSKTTRESRQDNQLLQGGTTGIFRKIINEETSSDTVSTQLPPKDAAMDEK